MKAQRPQPKVELHVIRQDNYLRVVTASQEAAEWIIAEAPLYCTVFDLDKQNGIGFGIINSAIFNPDEVVAYLLSYLDEES